MDTKTLVVGQDVYMLNSVYIRKGKVVKVRPDGVDVQEVPWQGLPGGELLHFDNYGREEEERLPSDQITPRRAGFPEWAPLYLDDIPFAERTAELQIKWGRSPR